MRASSWLRSTPRAYCAGEKDDGDEREAGQAAPSNPAFQRIPAVGQRVTRRGDGRRPNDRAGGVIEQKLPPGQAAAASEHGAKDAQSRNEPRDEHRARAIAVKKAIELQQARQREPDAPSMAFSECASEAPADQKAEVVTEDRGHNRRDNHPAERQPPKVGQCSAGEQRRLAGHRQTAILEKDARKHDGIPIAGEQIDEPRWHTYKAISYQRSAVSQSCAITLGR